MCSSKFVIFIVVLVAVVVGYLQYQSFTYQSKIDKLLTHLEDAQGNVNKKKQLVMLAACTINLAETSRMLLLGDYIIKHHSDKYDVMFYGYKGGQYAKIVEQHGHNITLLSPAWTPEQVALAYKVDQGEELGDIITEEEAEERLRNELALFRLHRPLVVFTGSVVSARLAAKALTIPLVMILPMGFSVPTLERGLVPFDYFLRDYPILPSIPNHFWGKMLTYWMNHTTVLAGPFQKVAIANGLKPFTLTDLLLHGDKVLCSDLPELIGIKPSDLPPQMKYVGPLYAKLEREIPTEVTTAIQQARDSKKEVLYFAMGSSGHPQIAVNILLALNDSFASGKLDHIGTVIAPVLKLLSCHGDKQVQQELFKASKFNIDTLDSRIVLTSLIPAHKVNAMADYAIIHGGQGTVQTAIESGTPFVGVAMQIEQEMNVYQAEKFGAAKSVPKSVAMKSGMPIVEKLHEVMQSDSIRQKAKQLQQTANQMDALAATVNVIDEYEQEWKAKHNL